MNKYKWSDLMNASVLPEDCNEPAMVHAMKYNDPTILVFIKGMQTRKRNNGYGEYEVLDKNNKLMCIYFFENGVCTKAYSYQYFEGSNNRAKFPVLFYKVRKTISDN